mgnify:CR=1 FL=1
MSAEDKLRHILKDEFRHQVLVAAMPELIALVELMLEELDAQRAARTARDVYMQQQIALHESIAKHKEMAQEMWARAKQQDEQRRNAIIKQKPGSFWDRFI